MTRQRSLTDLARISKSSKRVYFVVSFFNFCFTCASVNVQYIYENIVSPGKSSAETTDNHKDRQLPRIRPLCNFNHGNPGKALFNGLTFYVFSNHSQLSMPKAVVGH